MKPKTCSECRQFKIKEGDVAGDCKKYSWVIDPDLAKRQAVCNEEDEAEKIEMVTVLSPGGNKVSISKEAYDREKNGENYWKPIHALK